MKEKKDQVIHSGHIFKGIEKLLYKSDNLRPMLSMAIVREGYLLATDSHQLVKIKLEFFGLDEVSINLLEGKCFDKDLLNKLATIKSGVSWFVDEQGFNLLKPQTLKVGTVYTFGNASDEGVYPNCDQVIPTVKECVDTINFNPTFSVNINSVYNNYKGKEDRDLYINFHGNNKGFTLDNESKTFLGLIMLKYIS